MRALVKDASKKYLVDPKRVYAFGLSGGGYFVHRLACEAPDVFAAIVSMSGATYKDASKCAPDPKHPISVAELHGDADKIVKYGGGHESWGSLEGDYPSAKETVGHWATYNGCSTTLSATSTTYDIVSDLEGSETIVERHDGCSARRRRALDDEGRHPCAGARPRARVERVELLRRSPQAVM